MPDSQEAHQPAGSKVQHDHSDTPSRGDGATFELLDPLWHTPTAWVSVGVNGMFVRPVGSHPDDARVIIEVHGSNQLRVYSLEEHDRGQVGLVTCFDLATGRALGVER